MPSLFYSLQRRHIKASSNDDFIDINVNNTINNCCTYKADNIVSVVYYLGKLELGSDPQEVADTGCQSTSYTTENIEINMYISSYFRLYLQYESYIAV